MVTLDNQTDICWNIHGHRVPANTSRSVPVSEFELDGIPAGATIDGVTVRIDREGANCEVVYTTFCDSTVAAPRTEGGR